MGSLYTGRVCEIASASQYAYLLFCKKKSTILCTFIVSYCDIIKRPHGYDYVVQQTGSLTAAAAAAAAFKAAFKAAAAKAAAAKAANAANTIVLLLLTVYLY